MLNELSEFPAIIIKSEFVVSIFFNNFGMSVVSSFVNSSNITSISSDFVFSIILKPISLNISLLSISSEIFGFSIFSLIKSTAVNKY